MNFLEAIAAMRRGNYVTFKDWNLRCTVINNQIISLNDNIPITVDVEMAESTDWEIVPEPDKKVWRRQYILIGPVRKIPFTTSDWFISEEHCLEIFSECRVVAVAAEREFDE